MNDPGDAPGPRGCITASSWRDAAPGHEMISLIVGNLSSHTTMDCLWRVFREYGRIGDVHRPKGRSYGFVRFLKRRDAEEAMRSLDGVLLNGRTLRVDMAQYDPGLPCSVRPSKSNSPSQRQTRDSRSRSRSSSQSRSNYDSQSPSRGLKFETQQHSELMINYVC